MCQFSVLSKTVKSFIHDLLFEQDFFVRLYHWICRSQNPSKVASLFISNTQETLAAFLPNCFPAHVPFMRTNVAIVLEGWETWDSCSCSRRWFSFQWEIHHILARRSTATEAWAVILPFALFKCSWSVGRLPSRSTLKQQMGGLYGAAGSILLQPRLLSRDPGDLCARRACERFQDFHLPFSAFCFSQPKAGQLGVLCSHEAQMSGCDTVSCRGAPCWRYIHLQSRIKDLSRGPILSLWFAGVVMCGRNSLGARATGQSLKLFSVSLGGDEMGPPCGSGAVCFLGLAFSMHPIASIDVSFFFLQMNMLMKLQKQPITRAPDSTVIAPDPSLESTL